MIGDTQMPTLAPSGWPEHERTRFWEIQQSGLPGNPSARGRHGAVTTALNGLAARVGLEALRQGGSAVDAALSTALTQITLGGGAVISFFGILALMHYEASSGEFTSLNAGWNTVRAEDDPLSIPGALNLGGDGLANMVGTGKPSGRTALVGGFMRGVEAVHARFGKLAFHRLFEAAIEIAEGGFPMTPTLARYIETRANDLSRLEETKAVFFKPDGTPFVQGELFRQPALAETLRRIALDGADYMYTGTWAAKCVAAVQADGGRMSSDDLAGYEPVWSQPIMVERGDRTLALLGTPCEGSANLVQALNLADVAEIPARGHWSESSDSLVRLAKCCSAMSPILYQSEERQQEVYPEIDFGPSARVTLDHARSLWEQIENGRGFSLVTRQTHSDNVVAIDSEGNMASLCHSINCLVWGKTAIVIDGVSVGDPASYMQTQIARTPRGTQLANPIELGILAKGGIPDIAWASMGVGLHFQTTQSMLNIIDFGMTVEEAANAPRLLVPTSSDGSQQTLTLRVVEGEFPDAVLEGTGLEIMELPPAEARFAQGLWVAIQRDNDDGSLTAISPTYTNGQAVAF